MAFLPPAPALRLRLRRRVDRSLDPQLASWTLLALSLLALLGSMPSEAHQQHSHSYSSSHSSHSSSSSSSSLVSLLSSPSYTDALLVDSLEEALGPSQQQQLQQEEEETQTDMQDSLEPEDTALISIASRSSSSSSSSFPASSASAPFHNAPIMPAVHIPSNAPSALTFRSNLPSRFRFQRLIMAAESKIKSRAAVTAGAGAGAKGQAQAKGKAAAGSKAKAKSTAQSRAQVEAKAQAAAKAKVASLLKAAAQAGAAPDGSDGDWTKAPVWWKDPSEENPENVKPWMEDNYGYVLKHHDDTQSNMNPDPYPAAYLGGGGRTSQSLVNKFALHRVMATPYVKGAPESVHAYQYPGAPPIPEIDANMQPTNNYPNAPFYEHNYNMDYIWG